jgi:lipoprotein-anchoring transpeptidase ErfK/SrfK
MCSAAVRRSATTGGPGNPLGARDVSRRHGVSHSRHQRAGDHRDPGVGRIRLTNQDISDLYSRVNVGTKVIGLPMDHRADNTAGKRE